MEHPLALIGNYIELLCKVSLAGIFLTAGIAKLFDPVGSRKAIIDFGFSEKLAAFGAVAVPVTEIILVVGFLLQETVTWYGALGCLVLLIIFTLMMLVQISQGNTADCHCFGQIYSQTVGPKSIVKNLLMMIPAVVLLFTLPIPSLENLYEYLNNTLDLAGPSFNFFSMIAIVTLLFIVIYYLKKLNDGQRSLAERLSMLSIGGGENSEHDHAHAHGQHEHNTSPEEGLPVGAPAPDFELGAMDGKTVSFDQLLMRGKPMLFFFISPTCSPCKGLLPEIGKWQDELRGQIEFIFISTGTIDENAEKLPQLRGQTLLLQKKREVAEAFMTKWTPTALLVNARGDIASRPAPGDIAIRDLIDLIKENPADVKFIENGRGMAPHKLKIGEGVPEFLLPNVNGGEFSNNVFAGKNSLALFFGLDCSHCHRMLPDVKEWEKSTDRVLQLIAFTSGDTERNRAEIDIASPLLLDEGNKIGTLLGMSGTPSAVLIDEEGRIASETAVGAPQIWSLIGKRK